MANLNAMPTARRAAIDTGGIPPSHQKPHDGLHLQEGLKYCWCKCTRCWLNRGHFTGICICMECTCGATAHITRSMALTTDLNRASRR